VEIECNKPANNGLGWIAISPSKGPARRIRTKCFKFWNQNTLFSLRKTSQRLNSTLRLPWRKELIMKMIQDLLGIRVGTYPPLKLKYPEGISMLSNLNLAYQGSIVKLHRDILFAEWWSSTSRK